MSRYRLPEKMRDALKEALRSDGLRRVHDDPPTKPKWPAPAGSLSALVRRGALTYSARTSNKGLRVEEWTITQIGRELLDPPAPPPDWRRDDPHHGSFGSTTTRVFTGGVWQDKAQPEPEKVPTRQYADDARERWERDQRQREAEYRSLPIAEQVRLAIEDARSAGLDTTLLERSILRRVESLRSKTRRVA